MIEVTFAGEVGEVRRINTEASEPQCLHAGKGRALLYWQVMGTSSMSQVVQELS